MCANLIGYFVLKNGSKHGLKDLWYTNTNLMLKYTLFCLSKVEQVGLKEKKPDPGDHKASQVLKSHKVEDSSFL